MTLFILRFGVESCAFSTLRMFSNFLLSLSYRVAAYWEIAAYSAYAMFSLYKDLIDCEFSFSHLGFWSENFFLIAPFPDHCLFFTKWTLK